MKLITMLNKYRLQFLYLIYLHIESAIYIFVNLKYIFGNKHGTQKLLLIIATAMLSAIMFVFLWTFKAIKCLVGLKISICERNKFIRLLYGTESAFLIPESNNNRLIITTVFLVDYQNDEQSFVDMCKQEVREVIIQGRLVKLMSVVRLKHGYYYLINSPYTIIQHFDNLLLPKNAGRDDVLTMEELREIISDLANAPMPCNNEALWEMRISNKQVKTQKHGLLYPMVLRFHHLLGDAMCLFNLFSTEFQHRYNRSGEENMPLFSSLNERLTKNPILAASSLTLKGDDNLFCRTNGTKHVVWVTEHQPQIINDFKNIKEKFTNLTVTTIIISCFLESWSQLMSEDMLLKAPGDISIMIPMLPDKTNFRNYGLNDNYVWDNTCSVAIIKVPVQMNTSETKFKNLHQKSLLQRLQQVQAKHQQIKNDSLDTMFNRWQLTVLLSVMPQQLSKLVLRWCKPSVLVSNIPGCSDLTFFGKIPVKEFVIIDPNVSTSGVSIMVTSYQNRLSFAYTIDKAVLSDIDDVRKLASNVYRNITLLRDYAAT